MWISIKSVPEIKLFCNFTMENYVSCSSDNYEQEATAARAAFQWFVLFVSFLYHFSHTQFPYCFVSEAAKSNWWCNSLVFSIATVTSVLIYK